MSKILIEGKEYEIKTARFRTLKKLSRLGITPSMFEDDRYGLDVISGLLAITCDISIDEADDILDRHLESGESLEYFTPLINSLVGSDFTQDSAKKK